MLEWLSDNCLYLSAIPAIILAVWTINHQRKDRAKIVLKYRENVNADLIDPTREWHQFDEYFVLFVTNQGRRPVRIRGAGVVYKDGTINPMVTQDQMPADQILNEGDATLLFLTDQANIEMDKIRYLFAKDSALRTHRHYLSLGAHLKALIQKPKL